jgi:sugar phosphate isomerase/epimerase
MKFAFMSFSCPQLDLDEMLALARRLGYDGIEPRAVSGHAHGVELEATADQRREINRKALDSGIAICCVATSCQYADPQQTKEQVEDTLRYIDLAGDVGAPVIRVFGGRIPEKIGREQAIVLLDATLGVVAQHAAQRGITVCVETHDDWCDPDHLAMVLQRLKHPSIAVNWDIMHPVRAGKSIDQAFETLRPLIQHVHFHDGTFASGKIQLTPIGQGIVDHRRALERLMEMGYEGYLSGEWINWEPYQQHLPRELATMKGYEEELAERR